MQKSDFYYHLPEELIAQTPVSPRNSSKLMCIDRDSGEITHKQFFDLENMLRPGDLLVMNDSRVIPARLYGEKDTGARVEFLLLKAKGFNVWETLVKPGKRAHKGGRFVFGDGLLKGEILESVNDGNRLVKFSGDFQTQAEFYNLLEKIGQMPLPPYITKKLEDNERYQTVYSNELGSAAAPTAGLHFTPEQLLNIRKKGVDTAFVTLHVGLGTFRPVKENNILRHKMHTEHYFIPAETAEKVIRTKISGGRVICVGTTSCRTLESAFDLSFSSQDFSDMEVTARDLSGDTDIFIYPGYEFKITDGLITNFHLPESTLIMLVSAFLGYEKTLSAYKNAVSEKYRFFSFGDAMFII
ncbi:MAG: tRNA preQ1(34) S-adenosylmethionine ribosyltransferase-isomerase QueA [Ruminococcus sp.]|jgi:S-adenosylmethionine:tRNA ribosyltransferase-isomerase|nr:tRNA preQ1(34) S-adenosylmethionine ribosyltransferase-isomerase QueA [Ruminococcus sp.]